MQYKVPYYYIDAQKVGVADGSDTVAQQNHAKWRSLARKYSWNTNPAGGNKMNISLRPVVMRYLRYTFLGLALAFSNRALEAQACRSGDDTASNFVDDVTMKVTAVDSDEVASRTYLGLPAASASTVSLVTDERTCQKALSAYNTARPQNSTAVAGSVYVVKAGSGSSIVYVVRTVPSNESEFTRVNVFDSKWKLLGGYGG